MWLLPLLVVGAIAAAIASRSKRARASQQLLPPGSAASIGYALPAGPGPEAGTPGPIAALGEVLSIGQLPPPTLILCAIAEARSIGRHDLAADIERAFVEPVIRMQILQKVPPQVQPPTVVPYERGSCAPRGGGGRGYADSCYAPQGSPPYAAVPVPAPPYAAVPVPTTPSRTEPASSAAAPSALSDQPAEDDISALLNSDPSRFMEVVSRNGRIPQAAPAQPQAAQPAAAIPQKADFASNPGSPIPGVPDANWRAFVVRLSRESPQFNSARHVGQYRQRRERLNELGLDPASIVGSPEAQRAALDVDMVDAYQHGGASNLFAQHLGRGVVVPGRDGEETISLSGVLGVIQVAGLEGAVNWLEHPNDRKRYPHTTQTFLHCNGVF